MAWICSKHGICPDSQRECEDCEYFAGDNTVHWTDDKDTLLVVKGLQAEIEQMKAVINHKPDCANAEHDGGGCLGYSGSHDDEPIEKCKNCEKYTGNN